MMDEIFNPCNRPCVEPPPTLESQRFRAHVHKSDVGRLVISSIGANVPQFTLRISFGGEEVCIGQKGFVFTFRPSRVIRSCSCSNKFDDLYDSCMANWGWLSISLSNFMLELGMAYYALYL